MPLAPSQEAPVLTVSELNRLARRALEAQLVQTWVGGEVSSFTRAPSGHWYFTLKDAQASVRCAMFRNRNQFLDWQPREGDHVEVRAQATLYEPRGEFQLNVEAMRQAGLGALFEAFNRLKAKLEAEGLFAPSRKRPLPARPKCIGLVTSPKAAALRDVLTTLQRRWPLARVVLYPTLVQGAGAAEQIAAAIAEAGRRGECEVLLIVRGGGSLEDLWAFNEERVARAIADCPIPTVSGIGHETDFTIADFVADLRAPTPTAAAQLATPDREEFLRRVAGLKQRLGKAQRRRLDELAQRLDGLIRRLQQPRARLAAHRQHLRQLRRRLQLVMQNQLQRLAQRLHGLSRRLQHPSARLAARRQQLHALSRRLRFAARNHLHRLAQRLEGLSRRLPHPSARLAAHRQRVQDLGGRLHRAVRTALARARHRHEALRLRLAGARPEFGARLLRLRHLRQGLRRAEYALLQQKRQRLGAASSHLAHLNPEAVLARGYGIVRDAEGRIVRDARQLQPGARLDITLARGAAEAEVVQTRP